jgi:hypothetical protein
MKVAATRHYRDSYEHLDDCLAWLDSGLRILLQRFHARTDAADVHGWFMSRKSAEALLEPARYSSEDVDAEAVRLREYWQHIHHRVQLSTVEQVLLALPQLAHFFRLSPIEEMALIVCIGAEIDAKYSRLYAYLQDDLTRPLPTPGLVAKLASLVSSLPAPQLMFSSEAPIFRWHLLRARNDGYPSPFVTQGLSLDPRVAAFLLPGLQSADQIYPFLRPFWRELDEGHPYEAIVDRLERILRNGRTKLVAQFGGPAAGEGPRVASALCRRLNLGLLRLSVRQLTQTAASGGISVVEGLRCAYREALLKPSAVYIAGFDGVSATQTQVSWVEVLDEILSEGRWLTLVDGRDSFPLLKFEHATLMPITLTIPDHQVRRTEWKNLAGEASSISPEVTDEFAARYPYTVGEIRECFRLAAVHATARPTNSSDVEADDLRWAARARSELDLGTLAQTQSPSAKWSGLILPEETLSQLTELCGQIRHRAKVLHEWGFARHLAGSKGLCALFTGASGTGKTLAAQVIAASVDLDLLKVDLAGVVSKYIGETEKHLEQVFQAAEKSAAILFFDEADALFGKRSEVRDAHDRYANIEINYLLQRLERFDGVAILATNFSQNLDEAFSRRIQFSVEFPFPNEQSRAAIWKAHLPEEAPASPSLDLNLLAKQYKITGGNIRNIVLNAAYLAADGGGQLEMKHLVQAARREYKKMGKYWDQ